MTADKKQVEFEKAVEIVQGLPKDGDEKPSQTEQLAFYALYKQATIGNVNIPRPGILDFTGKAKWDAWKEKEGLSKEDAQAEYVKLLREYLEKFSDKEQATKLLAQLDSA
ncbi:hypothetical protein CROQUDRAFT_132120 [Cronartium quercuum f. sp. fusiforme G11]|uniref:ACB domain-containing protein n=1 Tax=Cronartium quercuum f. sp. fusiforme G11 TaxID=708437 RepID=A0A9P6NPZ3_9BASI|nr:hypothetical protein CROQUDRAFT_132120 [Cronartium quercuum f. sp. fusiforme G11]